MQLGRRMSINTLRGHYPISGVIPRSHWHRNSQTNRRQSVARLPFDPVQSLEVLFDGETRARAPAACDVQREAKNNSLVDTARVGLEKFEHVRGRSRPLPGAREIADERLVRRTPLW